MEALKRSLAGSAKPKAGKAVARKSADKLKAKRPKKRIEGQREMLLPIDGKAPAKQPTATANCNRQEADDQAGAHGSRPQAGLIVGKRVLFDEETWAAINLLRQDRHRSFQQLADEAFRDLPEKHDHPFGLKKQLCASLRATRVTPTTIPK